MTAALVYPYVALVVVCRRIVVGTPQTAAHVEKDLCASFPNESVHR